MRLQYILCWHSCITVFTLQLPVLVIIPWGREWLLSWYLWSDDPTAGCQSEGSAHHRLHLLLADKHKTQRHFNQTFCQTKQQSGGQWSCCYRSLYSGRVMWLGTFHWFSSVSRRMFSIWDFRATCTCSAGVAGVKLNFKLHALILPNPGQSFV